MLLEGPLPTLVTLPVAPTVARLYVFVADAVAVPLAKWGTEPDPNPPEPPLFAASGEEPELEPALFTASGEEPASVPAPETPSVPLLLVGLETMVKVLTK